MSNRQNTLKAKFNELGGIVALYHSAKWNSVAEFRLHSTEEVLTSMTTARPPRVIQTYDSDSRPPEEQEKTLCDGARKFHDTCNDVQVTALGHYCVRWERTEEQKRIRRLIGDNGGIKFQGKQPALRQDGCTNTISTYERDNLILCARFITHSRD